MAQKMMYPVRGAHLEIPFHHQMLSDSTIAKRLSFQHPFARLASLLTP